VEDFLKLALLVPIGMVAGFLNITAGGGSLLALPFLIFLGLPPTVANGTNRVAILVQNIFATTRFHKFAVIPKEITFITTIPAVVGAIGGAQMAVQIDELLFKRLLAVVMILVMGFMFFGRGSTQRQTALNLTSMKKLLIAVAFFAIGVYGGFIQGGIGFLLITALTLTGYDLVKTNALKVLVVLIFTPFALAIFIWHGQVDFLKGFILAIGNGAGAWVASRVVVEKGHNFVRWIVMATVVVFAVKLFWG